MADNGTILRLAGKVYVLEGTKAENLVLLRQLSRKDFLSAPWHEVPFKVRKVVAANHEAGPLVLMLMLRERIPHSALFGFLIRKLAKEMPMQCRTVSGKPRRFRMALPARPLMLSTIVLEKNDGRQTAMLPLG